MKPFSLSYQLATYLSLALTVSHPLLQIEASTTTLAQEYASDIIYTDRLENGLRYSLMPASSTQGGTWVKISCPTSYDEDNALISLLTFHTLFYGTQQFDRQAIIEQLNQLGLDIEADLYLGEQSLQFGLSEDQMESLEGFLTLLQQMVFSPTLGHDEVELARHHLLQSSDWTEKEQLTLQSITASEVRQFYANWFKPERMNLTLMGFKNSDYIIQTMNNVFDIHLEPGVLLVESENIKSSGDHEGGIQELLGRVDIATDNQSRVIDGKIWMKEPNWFNKTGNGRALGALLTVLGIGGMVMALPISVPVALLAGSLTTVTGVYFLTGSYLKDPYYVESMRQQDLQKGCAHAYKNHRAGITLTPYERRILFLQEMVDHPQKLPRSPIHLLADLYQLTDPILAEIFTVDEFNVLNRLRRDFIQQRNQYKMLKEALENELVALMTPYDLSRDASLLQAREEYNQNNYVVYKLELREVRDKNIDAIEKAYKDIDDPNLLKDKQKLIKDVKDQYEDGLSSMEVRKGLEAADSFLAQRELEIQATYLYQIELCKQSLRYHERMAQYEHGEKSVIGYFDHELRTLLLAYPVYLTTLPDYLDLRGL